MNNREKKAYVGCVFGLVRLIAITPLWVYLIYTVLSLIAAPTYLFVIFWIYVGLLFGLAILEGLVQVANS